MDEVKEKKPAAKTDYSRILSIIIMAVMFLTGFGFGGEKWFFLIQIVGIMATLGCFILVDHLKFSKDEKMTWFINSIPLIVFAIFSSFSRFHLSSGFAGVIMAFVNALGIIGFYLLGILFSKIKPFSQKSVLAALAAGIALLVLISMIASLANYGPFYLVRYSGKAYYFDGISFPITEEYTGLYGFSIIALTTRYGLSFAVILASILGFAFYLKPVREMGKEERITNGVFLCSGLIGLLALVFAMYTTGLIIAGAIILFSLLIKFIKAPKEAPKWEKIVLLVFGALVIIYFLVLTVLGIKGYTSSADFSNVFLRKVFANPISAKYLAIVNAVATKTVTSGVVTRATLDFGGLFGFGGTTVGTWATSNKVFEFSVVYEGGLIAFFALIVMFLFVIAFIRNYFHKYEKIEPHQIVAVSLILGFVLYNSFYGDVVQKTIRDYIHSQIQSAMFMVFIFLVGTIYGPIFKKKEKKPMEAQVEGGNI
ncbi:MAG: hypothetical protein K5694_05500 [Bacilli bacterium]|nr:hypothetical protein [Bacilli bacterium]